MLNIVIPMAGRGSRFAEVGFQLPKPLIPIEGRPMIQWVVDCLSPCRPHRFLFLCLAEHLAQPMVIPLLQDIAPGCIIVPVDHVTEGAACTVLLARNWIDNDTPLMIANSDQWLDADIDSYLEAGDDPHLDGLIMTFPADHPKWSYVLRNPDGRVARVVEKEVVSREATVGVYNFRRGSDFVRGADAMVAGGKKVRGEYYVAPVYSELIQAGARVETYAIGTEGQAMHGLGTPEDLEKFLAARVCA